MLLLNVVRLIILFKFSFDTQLESLSLLAVLDSGGKQFDEVAGIIYILFFKSSFALFFLSD